MVSVPGAVAVAIVSVTGSAAVFATAPVTVSRVWAKDCVTARDAPATGSTTVCTTALVAMAAVSIASSVAVCTTALVAIAAVSVAGFTAVSTTGLVAIAAVSVAGST